MKVPNGLHTQAQLQQVRPMPRSGTWSNDERTYMPEVPEGAILQRNDPAGSGR